MRIRLIASFAALFCFGAWSQFRPAAAQADGNYVRPVLHPIPPEDRRDHATILDFKLSGDVPRALDMCNEILCERPGSQDIRLLRSIFLVEIGQYAKADQDVDYMIEKDPAFWLAYNVRASIFLQQPVPEEGEHPIIQWLKSGDPLKELAALDAIHAVIEEAQELNVRTRARDQKEIEAGAETGDEATAQDVRPESPDAEQGPAAWVPRARRVGVATPEGEQEKEITYYCNAIGMEFVRVPAGDFMMGSGETVAEVLAKQGWEDRGPDSLPPFRKWFTDEHPQHQVSITKSFFLGAHEVTQAEYEAVMGTNPSYFKGPNRPVEMVSWNEAQEFCRRLSKQDGITYRLPTEAEWEYACRAGTTTPFYTGKTISTEQANYDGCQPYAGGKAGERRKKTVSVGSFAANPWGLYDMHGNVQEWCQDQHGEYDRSPVKDPSGSAKGGFRVLRGGCYDFAPSLCRSAKRGRRSPADVNAYYGFRVVAVRE